MEVDAMYIKLHYDLPKDCVIDVEIQKSKKGDSHTVSILARKGIDSRTRYVLHPHNFKCLINPQVHVHTFGINPNRDEKDLMIEIYEKNEKIPDVYFYLDASTYSVTVVAERGQKKVKL